MLKLMCGCGCTRIRRAQSSSIGLFAHPRCWQHVCSYALHCGDLANLYALRAPSASLADGRVRRRGMPAKPALAVLASAFAAAVAVTPTARSSRGTLPPLAPHGLLGGTAPYRNASAPRRLAYTPYVYDGNPVMHGVVNIYNIYYGSGWTAGSKAILADMASALPAEV